MSIQARQVGLIGYGSMGFALAAGMAHSDAFARQFSLCVYAKNRQAAQQQTPAIRFAESLSELVGQSHMLIIAVRPEQVAGLMQEIASLTQGMQNQPILISVAAGVPLSRLAALAGGNSAVLRLMPNTLVEVGKGLFGLCAAPHCPPEAKKMTGDLFSLLGAVVEIEEKAMNAFTALAGCGPGFLFHIMDSLCEAGVSVGLDRAASRTMAAALFEGCGRLAVQSGRHPVILREQGTSPAGMTIAGLNHLDKFGVRGLLIEAVKIAAEQGKQMDGAAALLPRDSA